MPKDAVATGTFVDSEELRHFIKVVSKRFALRLTLSRVMQRRQGFPPLAEVSIKSPKEEIFFFSFH